MVRDGNSDSLRGKIDLENDIDNHGKSEAKSKKP